MFPFKSKYFEKGGLFDSSRPCVKKKLARGIQSRCIALLIELESKANKSFWKSYHYNREIYNGILFICSINFNEDN